MTRWRTILVTVVLVASTLAIGAPGAGGSSAYFGVTDVEVAPSTPAPGETARLAIQIKNFENSPNTIEITKVAIRTGPKDDQTTHATVEDVGTLSPGAGLTVPLQHTFDEAGTHSLRIHVWAEANFDEEHITYPVTVRVREEHPSLALQEGTRVVGTSSAVSISLTNGLESDIRDVSIRLLGQDVTGYERANIATLASGDAESLGFNVTPQADGPRTVTAELSYTTDGGIRRTTTETLRYTADPLETGVALDTERAGDGDAVRATITNEGNVPVKRLVITGTVDDRTVARTSLGTLPAGETTSVLLNASSIAGTNEMDVTATFRQAGRTREAAAKETVSGNPATIELTGLDVEMRDGKVHVTGSTSNVGLKPASSVVVRVLPAEGVTPAYPGRNYFVGTVPASDFVSFDVYATITENATVVPLEVTYLRDGDRVQSTVEVPVEDLASTQQGQHSESSGLGLPVIGIGVVVILGVVGLIGLAWRNYRDGA